jgi:hypothetical protein
MADGGFEMEGSGVDIRGRLESLVLPPLRDFLSDFIVEGGVEKNYY